MIPAEEQEDNSDDDNDDDDDDEEDAEEDEYLAKFISTEKPVSLLQTGHREVGQVGGKLFLISLICYRSLGRLTTLQGVVLRGPMWRRTMRMMRKRRKRKNMSLNPSGSSTCRSTPISNGSLTCLCSFPGKKEPEAQMTDSGKTFYCKAPAEKPRDDQGCIAINIQLMEDGTYLTCLVC